MRVRWSDRSKSDLTHLFDYLAAVNEDTAAGTIQRLVAAGHRVGQYPQMGKRWAGFESREVRSIVVGPYELLYEVRDDSVEIARVYHVRQDRSFRLN